MFGDPSNIANPDEMYDWIMFRSSNPSEIVANVQTVIKNATEVSDARNYSQMGIWSNISVPDITIELTSFNLTPEITFDAVTFALPVNATINDIWMRDSMVSDIFISGSDPVGKYYRLGTPPRCNDHACIIATPNINGTYMDQVRLIRLCMNSENDTTDDVHYYDECNVVSKTSVLVYSVTHHLSMDEYYMDLNSRNVSRLIMKNPLTTYYVTVGRLSWNSIDLAPTYAAICETNVTCSGLKYALSNGQQHLVLGVDHIPTPRNISFIVEFGTWQILAAANTQIDSYYQGSVVYLPMYPKAEGMMAWSTRSGDDCTRFGSYFINDFLQQHMYSYDSLQPAYTAAMFWLFQNAAVVDRANSTTAIRLDFAGNRM